MSEENFPYNLPIWRDAFRLESPDGRFSAEIARATEVSMGNPTCGKLSLSTGFELADCNPSFIWSDDSLYLAVPQYFYRFKLFRRQHLILIAVATGEVLVSKQTACYFQPESFVNGELIVTMEPHDDAETIRWTFPDDLDQFDLLK